VPPGDPPRNLWRVILRNGFAHERAGRVNGPLAASIDMRNNRMSERGRLPRCVRSHGAEIPQARIPTAADQGCDCVAALKPGATASPPGVPGGLFHAGGMFHARVDTQAAPP